MQVSNSVEQNKYQVSVIYTENILAYLKEYNYIRWYF